MAQSLVIVESPNKTKKIESILGASYIVQASYGHIMDLDPKNLSIDVENNFTPHYIVMDEKKKVVSNLMYHMKKCSEVIIASDMDREGEAIGNSIATILKLNNPKRIVFNAITKKAITEAISKPGLLNMDMVYAQQARRLLDRLMGYMISPILQKYLQGRLSAGRVQSVVVRIIVDMEKHVTDTIMNNITNPFFKSDATFNYNDLIINSTLYKNNEVYHIKDKVTAIDILKKLDNTIISKVINVSVKESKKSPPPPHITSTLMQEASTKFGMNSKRTMEVAQSLYEGGYITYMRTDSTDLSQEAINDIKKYVIDNYGDTYYMYRSNKGKSKDEHAQEAHEAIRPTHIEDSDIKDKEKVSPDMIRLYSIIWKRAVASLMSNALINIQTIDIDITMNNHTILPDETLYRSTFEEIKFDGYLVLYNDHESENIKGLLDIKPNTNIKLNNMNMNETFTSPPLRYNEAGLIKYLKKEGIGRPSTYASIISKVIEREYVKIINVDGIEKEVLYMTVDSKKYGTIKEKTKKIKVGSEKQKLVPTELGNTVNNFMMTHFSTVMGIEFTANMENMLDMIANGKAKWYNVLNEYYKLFSPVVDKLNTDMPSNSMMKNDDKCLGEHEGNMIYLTKNKYGWCVKMLVSKDVWKYGNIGEIDHNTITLEEAVDCLQYPQNIGKIGANVVTLCKGKYGFYYKIGSMIIGIKDVDDVEDMNIDHARLLYETNEKKENNTYMIGKTKVYVKTGDHGPYIMIPHGTKKPTFVSIPKTIDHTKITATKIKELIDKHKEYKKKQ